MINSSQEILNVLKNRGHKITEVRKAVVEVLATAKLPLSIQQIVPLVLGDEASVYRTISLLLTEHLIEELTLPGKATKYAISHGHHHHAVCLKCDLVVHLSCDSKISTPKKIPGFSRVDNHDVTFYGLCTKCS
jgi:Fur family transcriptional regulator, ferric uptake regulator